MASLCEWVMPSLRSATEGNENGVEKESGILLTCRERKRSVTVWHFEAVCECDPERVRGQKSEAPAARWEARQGKTDYLFSVLRPAAGGAT